MLLLLSIWYELNCCEENASVFMISKYNIMHNPILGITIKYAKINSTQIYPKCIKYISDVYYVIMFV